MNLDYHTVISITNQNSTKIELQVIYSTKKILYLCRVDYYIHMNLYLLKASAILNFFAQDLNEQVYHSVNLLQFSYNNNKNIVTKLTCNCSFMNVLQKTNSDIVRGRY